MSDPIHLEESATTTNNAPKRAPIVIDAQNEYFMGGLPTEYSGP